MVQALLEDRFKLVLAHEPREEAQYVPPVDCADGRVGPGMRAADEAECKARRASGPLLPPRAPVTPGGATFAGVCRPMLDIVRDLSRALGATVVDQTRLGAAVPA
jgi:uncharacterized protein (TIGR03435 family)